MQKASAQEEKGRVSKVGRSVKDFPTETSLFDALQIGLPLSYYERDSVCDIISKQVSNATDETSETQQHVDKKQKVAGSHQGMQSKEIEPVWALPDIDLDPLHFEKNTLSSEFNRLQVLKSFRCLDERNIDALDTLTRIGSRTFGVAICAVSLVDLDRIWIPSGFGFGDACETTRKNALCSWCIMSQAGVMVVPDTTKDKRFTQDPLVIGGPECRFYAGAALVSPEGTYY
jgi:hypothetical protein